VVVVCCVLVIGAFVVAAVPDQPDRLATRFAAEVRIPAPGEAGIAPIGMEGGGAEQNALLAGTWTTESVEMGDGWYIDQAYSTSGNAALAYVSADRLRFATYDGARWTAETIAKGSTMTGVSLAYGPGGAAVSYVGTGKGGGIKLATRGPLSWVVESVEAGSHGEFTSLAYDGAGNPAIAYLNPNRKVWDLIYARKVGGAWTRQVVDTGNFRYVALAFDAGFNPPRPAIAYAAATPGTTSLDTLKFASWDGTAWVRETVLTGTVGYGVFCNLAFHPLTHAATIVHSGSSASGGLFTTKAGSTWSTQSFDDCFDYCGRNPSVAFTADGIAWISSIRWASTKAQNQMRAASYDGAAWSRELVDTFSSNWVSVGIAPGGQPTLGYEGVRFARRTP